MIKFRIYFDKDEETKWLNEMSKQGWAFKSFFAGFYTFEECEPGQYEYQIDFGDKLCSVSEDYRNFMSEASITIVQTWFFWVILRRPAKEGTFELYTDVDSQIEHYKKIRFMFKVATIVEIICFFMELFAAIESKNLVFAGFAVLILAVLILIAREALHITNIIRELNERKTGIEEQKAKNISMLLPTGLLLNSAALLIADTVSYPIKLTVQILAIGLMLTGLVLTAKGGKNSEDEK